MREHRPSLYSVAARHAEDHATRPEFQQPSWTANPECSTLTVSRLIGEVIEALVGDARYVPDHPLNVTL